MKVLIVDHQVRELSPPKLAPAMTVVDAPEDVVIGWPFIGGVVVSPTTPADYFIDENGTMHFEDAEGLQTLNCAFDDELILDGGSWRVLTQNELDEAAMDGLVSAIKAECGKRIYEVASAETQMNMSGVAAFIGSKTAGNRDSSETDHLTAYGMSLEWVAAMRANVITLASDPELDMSDDANWPVVPDEVATLAAAF